MPLSEVSTVLLSRKSSRPRSRITGPRPRLRQNVAETRARLLSDPRANNGHSKDPGPAGYSPCEAENKLVVKAQGDPPARAGDRQFRYSNSSLYPVSWDRWSGLAGGLTHRAEHPIPTAGAASGSTAVRNSPVPAPPLRTAATPALWSDSRPPPQYPRPGYESRPPRCWLPVMRPG